VLVVDVTFALATKSLSERGLRLKVLVNLFFQHGEDGSPAGKAVARRSLCRASKRDIRVTQDRLVAKDQAIPLPFQSARLLTSRIATVRWNALVALCWKVALLRVVFAIDGLL